MKKNLNFFITITVILGILLIIQINRYGNPLETFEEILAGIELFSRFIQTFIFCLIGTILFSFVYKKIISDDN